MNDVVYSICLVPQEDDEKYLHDVISSLAKKYASYSFIPHLTIYGLVDRPIEELKKTVDAALAGSGPFVIKMTGLKQSDIFTKTVFIEYAANIHLEKIFNALRARLLPYKDYVLHPHVSLLYKHGLTYVEKQNIIGSLAVKKELTINRCSIWTSARPLTTEEDVKGLKIVYEKKLT